MFDGLLKSKFYSKCKSNIKLTRTRNEMLKRKRNAVEKHLRNDVAVLLKNELDYDAYDRAEGLLVDLNRSHCYELIDQYCELILKHLSAMDKQRECPEECREAASSLTLAAARFADLPELRELRTIFTERYGNPLDTYINKQFAEKSESYLPSKDMKLQLLQDIATKSGLEWNSKAVENKLCSESPNDKDSTKEIEDRKYYFQNHTDGSVQKNDNTGRGYEFQYDREFPEKDKDLSFYEQKEASRNEDLLRRKTESASPRTNELGPPVKDIQVDRDGKLEPILKPSPHHASTDSSKTQKHRSRDVPNRVSSLPADANPMKNPKTHTRAASFHPDLLNANAHVHPKLPDYDDFVARLAAFRADSDVRGKGHSFSFFIHNIKLSLISLSFFLTIYKCMSH